MKLHLVAAGKPGSLVAQFPVAWRKESAEIIQYYQRIYKAESLWGPKFRKNQVNCSCQIKHPGKASFVSIETAFANNPKIAEPLPLIDA